MKLHILMFVYLLMLSIKRSFFKSIQNNKANYPDNPEFDFRQENFFFSKTFKPVLGNTHPLIQGLKQPGRESNTHLHLVSMLKMTGATFLPPLDVFKSWTRQI